MTSNEILFTEAPQVKLSSTQACYNEGSSVNISCTASGTPEPEVKWIRNRKVESSGKKAAFLTISSIKRADAGMYICRANNSAGQDVKHVTLVIPYPPTIKEATTSTNKTWIGQTVTLKCVSGGVPTPTLTWYKPDGSQLNSVTATQNTVNVKMNVDQDFGGYKCDADNGLTPADYKIVEIAQIRVPTAPRMDDLSSEIRDDTITLKWSESQNNGKEIIQYTVYQRVMTDGKPGEWIKLQTITDTTVRQLKVELEKGKTYEFVVTATNEFGESRKEDGKIQRIKTLAPPTIYKKSKSEVAAIEGNILFLVCEAEGSPTPHVSWRKNGKVLQSSINKTDFMIDDASKEDAGSYKCKVSNSVGTISHTVEVTVKGSGLFGREHVLLHFSNSVRTGCGGELVVLNPMALPEPQQQSSSMAPSGDSTNYAAPMPLHQSGRSWEINREQVKNIKVIGKGAFSQVAKATAWNLSGDGEYTTVAVKMLKANAPESDRKDLLSELELMKKLKPHPHVIKLIGCVTKTDPPLVLIEYVPFGDLLGYLRKSRGLNDTCFKDPDVKPQTSLTAEQLMRFAWQIADGMFYLSSRKIIHRDLAARNVLVGEGEKCKVTDFGMARNVHQDDIYTRKRRLELWCPAVRDSHCRSIIAVKYFYVLHKRINDITSSHPGGSPYPGTDPRNIASKLQEGFRMPKPKHVDSKL
ncbi:hypothetical protein ACROYT_G027796 [Oculina patagonica]